jgi:branched-chain amino acid aminotransferase
VCGTAAEVIGLREIDYRTIHDGKTGPITREIQKMYHDIIRGKIEKYEDWCEYVSREKVKAEPQM